MWICSNSRKSNQVINVTILFSQFEDTDDYSITSLPDLASLGPVKYDRLVVPIVLQVRYNYNMTSLPDLTSFGPVKYDRLVVPVVLQVRYRWL